MKLLNALQLSALFALALYCAALFGALLWRLHEWVFGPGLAETVLHIGTAIAAFFLLTLLLRLLVQRSQRKANP